ncbi:MAG: sulfite exporter TauE/SafE family protein [Actinomycetota bacterium]|nr:sulfite exporter TauE/SafE family protein [Actinomycetota bacterium]
MSWLDACLIALAGMAAGSINVIVGSGTLITFPTLLALGYPPVTANVSNTVGLVPGSLAGVVGYRRELRGQRSRLLRLGSASLLGGVLGAVLLLRLPSSAFDAVVPVLIGLGVVLVAVQPRVSQWLKDRAAGKALAAAGGDEDAVVQVARAPHGSLVVWVLVLLTGVYGGYFGAAQGVLLLAVMGIGIGDGLQRLNAVKNVLAMLVNLVAGVIFVVVADVRWDVVGLIALGATLGGLIGARIGRALPPIVFRVFVVLVGVVAIVALLV